MEHMQLYKEDLSRTTGALFLIVLGKVDHQK